MISLRRFLSAALLAALCACAAVDSDDPGRGDKKPAVLEEGELGERTQAVTYEAFYCSDDWGVNCGPVNRYDNRWMRLEAKHTVAFYPYGESGEGLNEFNVQNFAGNRYIERSGSSDTVQWTITFPAGSTCNTWGNCSYHICIETGIATPGCIDTWNKSGASSKFTGAAWPAGVWMRWRIYYQIANGPAVSATTSGGSSAAYLIVWHTPL